MKHRDHVWLIEKAIPKGKGIWADFGSGDGAFTLALRDIAGEEVEIYSIDKDNYRLANQHKSFLAIFPKSKISFVHADFTKPLDLPSLDGILMANSLHFVQDKVRFLRSAKQYLKVGGKFVLVEYNVDHGNIWVPYPLSYETFVQVAQQAGFAKPEFLERISSEFLQEIYSAAVSI